MNRKNLVTLVVFIVLGIVAWQVMKQPPKGQRTGERRRPLPRIAIKDVDRVTIAQQGKPTVTLASEGAHRWKLVEPLKYAADKYASKRLGEALEKLDFGDLVTERKDKHGLHQVDAASAVRVTVKAKGGKTLADFYLGKAAAGFTMLRVEGQDAVWQVVGSLRATFGKDLKSWRDRTILSFKREAARELRVITAAGEITLSRKDQKAPWKVDKSSSPVDQLDADVPRGLISALSNLSAADFVDDAQPGKTGLDQPQATVVVKLDGSKGEQTVKIGKKENDSFFVAGSGPQVFSLKQYAADNLIKRPIDFRDKTILGFKAKDLIELKLIQVSAKDRKRTTIKLTRKADDWHRDGKKLADAAKKKVDTAAQTLASLKADRFAKHSAEELGMARPEWTIELRLKDRTRHRLTVGPNNKDGFFGVRHQGVADLFACRQYKLNKFLLKQDALK